MFPWMLLLGLVPILASADVESSFAELRRRAAQKSPEVAAARAVVDEKSAAARAAWAAWLPQAEISLSQNYSKDFSFLTSGVLPPGLVVGDPRQVNLASWSLSVGLPLYRRSVHLGVEAGARERDAAEADLDARLAELDARLRDAVGRYLVQAYQVEALETSLQIAKQSLRETQVRFQMGSRTKIDLLRAEANVVSLDSKRLGFQQGREAGRNSVLETSGLSEPEFKETGFEGGLRGEGVLAAAIDRFADVGRLLPKLQAFLDESSSEKLQTVAAAKAPEAAQIAAHEAAAESRAGLVVAPHWPELSLQGRFFKQAPAWDQALSAGQNSYSFGVLLKIPLSLGGGLLWTLQERTALARAAEVEKARGLRSLASAVVSERLQVLALSKSVASFGINVKQNEEIVRLSSKSYELGRTTLVEYLGAQNDLLDAKMSLAKAKVDLSVLARRFAVHLGVKE